MKTLVLMEHDGTALRPGSGAAIGFARELSDDDTALVLGENLNAITADAAKYGLVLAADHPALAAPVADRWAHVIAEVARAQNAELIVATSTTWAKDIGGRAAGHRRRQSGRRSLPLLRSLEPNLFRMGYDYCRSKGTGASL